MPREPLALKAESFAPPFVHETDISRVVEGRASENTPVGLVANHNGLDTALMHIAQQCGVSVMLVQWHPKGADVRAIFPTNPAATPACQLIVYRDHAKEAVIQASSQTFETQRWQLFSSGNCCTAVIALAEGIVTLTVVPLSGPGGVEARCAKLESCLPFVAVCFEQWLATQHVITRARSFIRAFEKCGTATILLGENGEILHSNNAAEVILVQKDGLCRRNERLVCANFTDTLRLQAALSHFHADLEAGAETTPVLAVARANRRPLTVALTAIRSEPTIVTEQVHAIAYVFDPEQKLSGLIDPVCQLYGLSRSETKLACALVAGDSLNIAAQRLRLQEQTARTYLKHIFEKTDTHRQAQLVQLMLESAVRLSSIVRTQAFT